MKYRGFFQQISFAFLFLLFLHSTVSPSAAIADPTQGANVILLTLDGVRWEEVFHGTDPGQSLDANPKVFEFLLGTLSKQGPLMGDRKRGESVKVSNHAQNSLPGYQSIMAGSPQPCNSNACGRISVETFPERIAHDLGFKPEQVAVISSWEKIAHAVEHVPGSLFVNAGPQPLAVGTSADAEAEAINKAQAADSPPWHSARYDKYTFAHSMNFLKKHKPRFMFISLNDSDEWGHKGKYDKYIETLRQQDTWIKELVTTLDNMGEYGQKTTLIITTDHGRGDANEWDEHGSGYANSGAVWLYGRSPYSRSLPAVKQRSPASEISFSHVDIRPTIETIFGLRPKMDGVSPLPGKVIESIAGRPLR